MRLNCPFEGNVHYSWNAVRRSPFFFFFFLLSRTKNGVQLNCVHFRSGINEQRPIKGHRAMRSRADAESLLYVWKCVIGTVKEEQAKQHN
ncbi:hypothetical protein CEXT_66711 [Caerostris extrusa]|uniref:Secreted protein n=1 Tax=Caerostris extrusa TaxID=172846 RepID=A0AAV4PE36_CAEEX|nr:hypothetical protein CEXT_66711 [Caerostris extrusa]